MCYCTSGVERGVLVQCVVAQAVLRKGCASVAVSCVGLERGSGGGGGELVQCVVA